MGGNVHAGCNTKLTLQSALLTVVLLLLVLMRRLEYHEGSQVIYEVCVLKEWIWIGFRVDMSTWTWRMIQ